jgi:hypothetical protein
MSPKIRRAAALRIVCFSKPAVRSKRSYVMRCIMMHRGARQTLVGSPSANPPEERTECSWLNAHWMH